MLGPGSVIAGRYRLDCPLGEGGMAAVHEATDLTLQRKVAVKLLFARDDRDPDGLIDRFLREARISAAVQHPHVVQIVDFGTTEERIPYMIMELLRGRMLADRLESEGLLPPADVIEIGIAVLRGLNAVHKAGIVHRDLKPENIFLVDGHDQIYPKILDFGISKSVDVTSGRESAHKTRDGIFVGTPDYMAPEQVRMLPDIDARTDLYSLGVIMYECLTGTMPFEAENVGDLMIHIAAGNSMPAGQRMPEIPMALSDVIETAMAVDRDKRFQTARDMQGALIWAAKRLDITRMADDTGPYEIPTDVNVQQLAQLVIRSSRPPAWNAAGVGPARAPESEPPHMRPTDPAPPDDTDELPSLAIEPKSNRAWWIGGGLLVLLVGIGAASLSWLADTAADAPAVVAAPASPGDPSDSTVTVTLRNLPEEAVVFLDGAVTHTPVLIPRDDAAHVIEVTHESMQPWRVTHVSDDDGDYEVVVVPIAVAEPEPPEMTEAEAAEAAAAAEAAEREAQRRADALAQRREARRESAMMAAMADGDEPAERPQTFRMLDF